MVGIPKLLRIPRRWMRSQKSQACPQKSTAQFLPSHIIQRIAHYVAAAYTTTYTGDRSNTYDQISRATASLVGVSRSWRVALIPMFYRHFVLDINCSAMWISPARKMVNNDSEIINDSVKHLAKSVYLTAPFDGIFNGRVAQILDDNKYVDAVFPEVNVLRLNFYSGTTLPVQETTEYKRYVDEFCLYIRRLFPKAEEYRFQVSPFTDTDDSQMVGWLLSELIHNSDCRVAEYIHSSGGVQVSGLVDVVGLTHLSIEDQACMEDCVELVRRNAATLVSVDLGISDAFDFIPRLVTNDDGSTIVYPNLTQLSIHVNLLPKDMNTSFPALKDLNCTTGTLRVANVLPFPLKQPSTDA
ncbi:hypothetical protein LPJ73_002020 [Coemansia sp. RSA 2703]|nr:hypothetical protein LPJ73_002020 [Coemansia sp. RSA 2703]